MKNKSPVLVITLVKNDPYPLLLSGVTIYNLLVWFHLDHNHQWAYPVYQTLKGLYIYIFLEAWCGHPPVSNLHFILLFLLPIALLILLAWNICTLVNACDSLFWGQCTLWISCYTVGKGVVRMYMYGIFPWYILSRVWSLAFPCHMPLGGQWWSSYFLYT